MFAKDEAPSFGFRPGYCAHDAAQAIFKKLNGGNFKRTAKTRVILEADIEGCFNEIDRKYLLNHLLCDRKVKGVVYRMLKAGVKGEFPRTNKGTTQGGVASPLLASVALHGIEKGMNMVRYADDFICVCATPEEAAARLETIKTRLALRGLKVKEAKTRIVKVTEGFDFLGWNFRWWEDDVFRIVPSKDNVTTNLRKLKEVRQKSLHLRPEDFLKKLNPIIRGWLNYHRFCGNRSKIDGRYLRTLWKQVERYLKRRGSFKSWKHYREYWRPKFAKAMVTTGNVPTRIWIKVQKGRSVYDGDTPYWSQRNSVLYDNFLSKALKKQKFKCGHCGLAFYPGESIELHHQDGNPNNRKANNLVALHRGCHQHQEIHSEARRIRTRAGTV